jgi:hemolysin III
MVRKNHTSIIEEVFNAITHGLGVILSIIGLIALLILAHKSGSLVKNIAFAVFGAAVTIAYLSSTLYHSLCFTRAKKVFRILDHSSILLLIAGTYTPFTLLALNNQGGLILFCLIWSFAITGMTLRAIFAHKFDKFFLALYLLMGWLIVFEAKPLLKVLPLQAVILLGTGGIFYTAGVAFYLSKKLPFHHMIWHIFVLCGSILHFCALFYL